MNVTDQKKMLKEMQETTKAIQSFNAGKIDLFEDELDALNKKREQLLRKYYATFFPKNITPLI